MPVDEVRALLRGHARAAELLGPAGRRRTGCRTAARSPGRSRGAASRWCPGPGRRRSGRRSRARRGPGPATSTCRSEPWIEPVGDDDARVGRLQLRARVRDPSRPAAARTRRRGSARRSGWSTTTRCDLAALSRPSRARSGLPPFQPGKTLPGVIAGRVGLRGLLGELRRPTSVCSASSAGEEVRVAAAGRRADLAAVGVVDVLEVALDVLRRARLRPGGGAGAAAKQVTMSAASDARRRENIRSTPPGRRLRLRIPAVLVPCAIAR